MTRPNIVRADTIDLQDQDNPTASEHQRPEFKGGLAPHQRAEVHHVLEERNTEEHALADAWNIAGSLTDEPEAIDKAQQQQSAEHEPTVNGTQSEGQEGGADTETDGEDDMMDRISSSPSIDDGGYTLHSSPPTTPALARVKWPVRSSSLSPTPRNTPTPTREAFNQSPISTSDSSPFLQTPQHLPLHVRRTGKEASPLARHQDCVSSPFDESPTHLPTNAFQKPDDTFSFPSKHHPMGRYPGSPWPDQEALPELEEYEEDFDGDEEPTQHFKALLDNDGAICWTNKDHESESSTLAHNEDVNMRPIESPFRRHSFTGRSKALMDANLEPSPSLTSIGSVDLQDVLLPIDDPLLDTPSSPTESAISWESLASSDSELLDESTIDDDTDALFANLDNRFIDSGWGGECLRETEDIDFEFVYALHTFVATVEGQANATKGDTMVLLDDSNSYWWLVRVVKDSSIGYLPAEHIETPTERLARLNKHRNIDLSATMLSDNSEKSRNPLKKAIRRRNHKTVQFAAPTYVEASDYDYETDDDEQPAFIPNGNIVKAEEAQQTTEQAEDSQPAEKRPSLEEHHRTSSSSSRASFDREQAATAATHADEPQTSPKLVDKTEAAPLKSRKTRNTDSFLKDDSIETRKITLTPGLLREETAGKNSTSTDSARNNSLENLVKQVSPPEQTSKKDNKKEKKEKKGGMLSGLFKSKKKDKKSKEDLEFSDGEKLSTEYPRDSPKGSPLTSGRASPTQTSSGTLTPTDARKVEVQTRQPSKGKLQKPPPATGSSPVREQPPPEQQPSPFVAELQGSEAAVEMAAAEQETTASNDRDRDVRPDLSRDQSFRPQLPGGWISTTSIQPVSTTQGPLSPITNMLKRDDSGSEPKPVKVTKAKQRVELDDFDSPNDEDGPNPFKEKEEREAATGEREAGDRLSESPVEITHNTFMHGTESIHIPTPSPYDQDEDEDDEPESLTSSPSIIEHPAEPLEESDAPQDDDATPTAPLSPDTSKSQPAQHVSTPSRGLSTDSNTTTSSNHLSPSSSVSQQSWSDSSLRAWLEDGSEVKDMMVMIHDTSDVVPVKDDHPLMAGLFTEQRKGVQNMMTELDGLLGSYLQRKGIALG